MAENELRHAFKSWHGHCYYPTCVENARKENLGNMKLIKPLLAGLAAIIIGAGFALSAQATSITGMLNISGTATYNAPIATATQVTQFNDVVTGGLNSGSFAGIPAMVHVTMTSPYIFNPTTPSPALWSVAGFTFDLTATTFLQQSSHGILIEGTGIIMGNNFDPTPGIWSFSQQSGKGTTLTFSATTSAVPDAGMTATLLGLGLAGLVGARRLHQRKAKA